MTEVGPPVHSEYRPFGTAGLMGGVSPSDPPTGGGKFISGLGGSSSVPYDYQTYSTMAQNTNEPMHSKYAVAYVRSKDETHRGMGAGRLTYGRTVKAGFRAPQNGLGGSIELNDPMCVSTLNKYLREPAQRKLYGSQITAPTDFKYYGIQATQGGGELGAWSNMAVTMVSAGVYNGFANVGLAHRKGYPGDILYGLWIRYPYKDLDLSTAYDSDDEDALQRSKARPESKETDEEKEARVDIQIEDVLERIREATADKEPQKLRDAQQRHAELLRERNGLLRGKQMSKFAQKQDAGRLDDKQQVSGSEFYWQLVPFVSIDGSAPPEALYLTDRCIGRAEKWLSYLTIDDSSGLSPSAVQQSAKEAIMPVDHTDAFLRKLVALPQCRVVVVPQK